LAHKSRTADFWWYSVGVDELAKQADFVSLRPSAGRRSSPAMIRFLWFSIPSLDNFLPDLLNLKIIPL
jgi:hypothetical protein